MTLTERLDSIALAVSRGDWLDTVSFIIGLLDDDELDELLYLLGREHDRRRATSA